MGGDSTPAYSTATSRSVSIRPKIRYILIPTDSFRFRQRNLKSNGGILDEVIFAVKTEDKADLAFVDELVQYPGYRKYVATQEYEGFSGSWECVNETDTIYVKVDDDVVSSISL